MPEGEALGADEAGAEGVEEDLEGAGGGVKLGSGESRTGGYVREERLPEDVVQTQQLKVRR